MNSFAELAAGAPFLAIGIKAYTDDEINPDALGYWAYTHDPKFSAYIFAASKPGGDGTAKAPARMAPEDWEALAAVPLWVSQNAAKEQAILLRLQELGQAPRIWPARWLCAGAMAAYIQAPREIEMAAPALLGRSLSPGSRRRESGYQPGSDFLLETTFMHTLLEDTTATADAWAQHQHKWPAHERALWAMTTRANRAGVHLDEQYVSQALAELESISRSHSGALPWTKEGFKPRDKKALERHCRRIGVSAPKSTEEGNTHLNLWIDKYLRTEAPTWIRHLQGFRKTDRGISLFRAMQRRRNPKTGRMDFEILYCGTDPTLRWKGARGINMQNLNVLPIAGVADPRRAFTPAPGHLYIIADLSQIEPRILAWVCGDEAELAQMRAGVNPYEAHARATMGWTGGNLKAEAPRVYAYAKIRKIQLGYQCAAETFRSSAEKEGFEISDDEARRQVFDFRSSAPRNVAFWDKIQDAFTACEGGTYNMPIPGGGTNRYFNVEHRKLDKHAWWASTLMNGEPDSFYGGKLTANLVSRTARELFAWQLLHLDAAGLPPVWTSHDEGIWEIREDRAEEAMATIKGILHRTPDFLPGLPVACSAEIARHYKK